MRCATATAKACATSTVKSRVAPPLATIVKDMQLARHGLQKLESPVRVFAPNLDGRALTLYTDAQRSAEEVKKLSARDATNYLDFQESLARIAGIAAQLMELTPPVIEKPSREDIWKFLKVGRRVRGLGKKEMMRLIRWGPMAAADFVAEFFETDLLRAVIAARGIYGAALGPWSAGSTLLLLLRAAADPYPVGNSAYPRGGMGALTAAMAAAAKEAGVEIRTGAEVTQILVKDGSVTGVALARGEEISAMAVVSGADPQRTLFAGSRAFAAELRGKDAELPRERDGRKGQRRARCASLFRGPEEFSGPGGVACGTDSCRARDRLSRAGIRQLQVRRIFSRAIP